MSNTFWIERALSASDDTLYEDVARHTIGTAYARDVVAAGAVNADQTVGFVNAADLQLLGAKILARISHESYSLFCSGKSDERDRLMNAVGLSDVAAMTCLVDIQTTQLHMSAPLAAAASAIILKTIIKPAAGGLCDFWKAKL